jgi:cellulose synthase/poly-beta-1,6-N-acetylglucosamine synthase-like glycosyltransferase
VLLRLNAVKAPAWNRWLAAARHDILVTVDADTVFEPETLGVLVQRFREPRVGAISGNTKVGNRRGLIGHWQHIEYVMGFNLDRRMYEVLGSTPTVPGAIGAFSREALAEIGGVSGATLAEDTDITLDIGRAGWRVLYEHRARAWTEAPSTLRGLFRQRSRWAYGTIQSMWKHRRALTSAGDGSAGGRAVMVILVFQILLPLAAPLIDLFAIYSIAFLDPLPILAFWVAFNLFQLVLAWEAFGFDGESRRVLWALPLQQIGHRQISYLVVYDAIVSALLGGRHGWRHAERTGTVSVPVGEPDAVEASGT